ncbi:MAG: hypothetical protein JWO36_4893, partial [Myxococcales bacterium]|nr:hypothetical protein [Myxococcales bacterium]
DTRALYDDESLVRQRLKANPVDGRIRVGAAKFFAARKQNREAINELEGIAKTDASPAEKVAAQRFADHLRRIVRTKEDLVNASVRAVRADYLNASIDDLIIATVGSQLPPKEVRVLYNEVFKAHANTDELIPYVYVALAAGLSREALNIAETLAGERSDPKRVALLAECKYANGDRTGALQTLDEAIALAKATSLETQLNVERVRIDAGSGDLSEVVSARSKASDLWQRVEKLDQLRFVARPSQATGLYSVVRAATMLAAAVGTQCATEAGAADRAYGTLDIDNATGQVVSSVLYLQDSTNDRLRECIEDELRAAKLPIAASRVPVQSVTFIFRSHP